MNLNICIFVLPHQALNTVTSSDDLLRTQHLHAKPQANKSFTTTKRIASYQYQVFQAGTTPHLKKKESKQKTPQP